VSAIPFFYSYHEGELYYGKSIFDVFEQVPFGWEWDLASLYCVNNFEHCIADRTIHKRIQRLPRATTLIHYQHKLTTTTQQDELSFNSLDIDKALAIYLELLPSYFTPTKKIALSLSAGMDSRLLLASAMYAGIRPIVGTMGHEQATDAQDLGLEHRVVSLKEDDYLDESTIDKIIHATSGTKTLANWHTYIYVKKLAFPSDHIHYVGSNGELVRSYYLDKGILTKALQLFDMGLFDQYFSLKLKKGDNYVLASIKDQVKREQVLKIITNTCPALVASDKLDYFYTFQRVRNFIGNGIALYNLNIPAESPFLDERFIRLGFGLKRKWKLNSLFHKMAIQKLYTKLLAYPNTESVNHIKRYDTNFYWTKNESSISYNITPKVFEHKTMKASVMDSNELKPWISTSEREDLFKQKRYRTLSFLVMLQHTVKKVTSIEKQKLKQIV
jgi:hypothetical protein